MKTVPYDKPGYQSNSQPTKLLSDRKKTEPRTDQPSHVLRGDPNLPTELLYM